MTQLDLFEDTIKDFVGKPLTQEDALSLIKIASKIQDDYFALIEGDEPCGC